MDAFEPESTNPFIAAQTGYICNLPSAITRTFTGVFDPCPTLWISRARADCLLAHALWCRWRFAMVARAVKGLCGQLCPLIIRMEDLPLEW